MLQSAGGKAAVPEQPACPEGGKDGSRPDVRVAANEPNSRWPRRLEMSRSLAASSETLYDYEDWFSSNAILRYIQIKWKRETESGLKTEKTEETARCRRRCGFAEAG